MFIEHIHHIMVRELEGMKSELLAYQDEAALVQADLVQSEQGSLSDG